MTGNGEWDKTRKVGGGTQKNNNPGGGKNYHGLGHRGGVGLSQIIILIITNTKQEGGVKWG